MTPDEQAEEAEGWLLEDPSPQTLAWAIVLVDIAQTGRRLTAARYHPDLMEFLTEVQATRMTGELHTVMELGKGVKWAEAIRTFKARRKLVLGDERKKTKTARKAKVLRLVPKPEAG